NRKRGLSAREAAIEGAAGRLRPILMTTFAMAVGMVPMALGIGESGDQVSPLGRAVIGGLIGSTIATLGVLPLVYAYVQGMRRKYSASLNPMDPASALYHEAG